MAELRFAGILGTGHYAPEKILSNADLEKMVDTSDEWIGRGQGSQRGTLLLHRKPHRTFA